MCGFAGVVAFEEGYRATREVLEGMVGCIAHRGPDGRGYHVDERAALGHVRLAILDPEPRSDQPFRMGSKWILFNGEVYNFRELRADLDRKRPGYAWRTTGDTEVLLRAYEVWGEDCLAKLNGMFAFAVWDEDDGSLFFARDRVGQKPLYYAVAPGGGAVGFGSELGVMKQLAWVDRGVDPVAMTHYLAWGYVPAPGTIYRGVKKLRQASWVRFWGGGRVEEGRYYEVNGVRPTGAMTVDRVREVVREGVRRQLVADVPVGCFLSGGVDSSIVAAGMQRAVRDGGGGGRVMTFAIGFEDARYDETAYAREVAGHLGTEHHEFRVTPDAAGDLPKLARVFGEPFGDSSALPTHYLARETRGFVKVALSGDGGDELFGGYERYRAMRLGERLAGAAGVLRGLSGAIPGVHPKSVGARARRFARSLGLPAADRYAEYVRLFSGEELEPLLNAGADPAVAQWFRGEFARATEGRDVVEAALAVDRETYLPEDLLTKVDRSAMLHALEVRSPFMDPDVLAVAGTLSAEQLIGGRGGGSGGGGKRMLREAFAGELPAAVFKRRKMGFAVPVGEWFRGALKGMLRETLLARDAYVRGNMNMGQVNRLVEEHERGSADHSQRLYALLMLELWWKQERA